MPLKTTTLDSIVFTQKKILVDLSVKDILGFYGGAAEHVLSVWVSCRHGVMCLPPPDSRVPAQRWSTKDVTPNRHLDALPSWCCFGALLHFMNSGNIK